MQILFGLTEKNNQVFLQQQGLLLWLGEIFFSLQNLFTVLWKRMQDHWEVFLIINHRGGSLFYSMKQISAFRNQFKWLIIIDCDMMSSVLLKQFENLFQCSETFNPNTPLPFKVLISKCYLSKSAEVLSKYMY